MTDSGGVTGGTFGPVTPPRTRPCLPIIPPNRRNVKRQTQPPSPVSPVFSFLRVTRAHTNNSAGRGDSGDAPRGRA